MTLPDGTKILPDGTTILPDGTTIEPDGTTTLPDGTERTPGGGSGDEQTEEILENGKPKLYNVNVEGVWHAGKGRRYAQSNAHYSRFLDIYDNYYGDKSSHPKDYWGGQYQKVEDIELKCPEGYRVRQIEAERTFVVTETKVGEYINWISITCVNLDKVTREVSRRQGFHVEGQTSTIACTGSEVPTGLASATVSWLAKNFELECAPFNQFEVESGEKSVDFSRGQRLFSRCSEI